MHHIADEKKSIIEVLKSDKKNIESRKGTRKLKDISTKYISMVF
jgi:hypothetical protein